MLVLEPCAGLSNRILAIATAYQLVRTANQKLEILWDIDGAVGAALQELFMLPGDIQIREMTKLPYKKKPLLRARSDVYRRRLRSKADIFLDCGDTQQLMQHGRIQQLQDWIDSDKLIYVKAFCELTPIKDPTIFEIFKPSQKIMQRGKVVFSSINESTIGFHIRRTDHEEAIRKSPLSLFLDKANEIIKKDQSSKIFVATDDNEVQLMLQQTFPDHIVYYQSKQFGRSDKGGMQDGLIDLLALSKCREIYGSYGSTFSRMASYLGNRELIILQKE